LNGPACTDGTTSGAAGADNLVPCWSCNGPLDQRAAFCHTCGAIQPPRAVDHFTRLGLAPSFDVELADMERNYFKLQRTFHPDRFATKSAKEKAFSLQQTTSLNEAYETLKDPLRRAQYLLVLKGRELQGQEGQTVNDPALLMEAMEMRENLAEADSVEQVDGIVADVKQQVDACIAALSQAFLGNDLDVAGTQSLRLKYLTKLIDDARLRRRGLLAVT
jgi:molecular chaperone HscB